jgi:hypothetical protein
MTMADGNTRDDEERVVHLLTAEEALTLINRSERVKRSSFRLHVRLDAPLVDEPGKVFVDGCSGYIPLSKAEARKLVSNMLCPILAERGGRIRITEHVWRSKILGDSTTYWIG